MRSVAKIHRAAFPRFAGRQFAVTTGAAIDETCWASRQRASFGANLEDFPDENTAMGRIAKSFPGALPGQVIDLVTNQVLCGRGFHKDTTIFAHATCPDEINADNISDDLINLFKRRWKGAFPLGGLGGIPFAGKTGWGAFSAHVPVEGRILLLFSPHVGISREGKVGYVQRRGQNEESTACGAAMGALGALTARPELKADPHDLQMGYILSEFNKRWDEIEAAECRPTCVTHMLYDLQVEYLRTMLTAVPPKYEIAVLGGIQLNLADPEPDHFMPMMFDLLSPNPDQPEWPYETVDLLPSLTSFMPGSLHEGKEHLGSHVDP